MKKALLAVGLCVALAGCQTAAETAQQIDAASQKVKEVQAYAARVCAYVPTAATVVSIFNSGFGEGVAAIGGAICNAVTTRPLADGPGDRTPRVNGVVIRGRWVK